jgi:tetratricopeptide (TPR) repeat protein
MRWSLSGLFKPFAHRLFVVIVVSLGLVVPAHAEWREATSPRFVIYSNGSERELVRYSQRLEAVHWLLTQATGANTATVGPRVRIFLVPSTADVREAAGAGSNSNVAGFYRTDQAGALAVVPRDGGPFSQQILFHEYAHHFMFQYMRANFPPWFVEGFAEVASTASFEREGTITWGKANSYRQGELDYEQWVDFATLISPRQSGDRQRGRASYGQYWLLAHYLIFAPERRGQMTAYIRAINGGTAPDVANAAFVGGLEQLDRDAQRYRRAGVFSYRQPVLPPEVMVTPTLRTMRPGEGEVLALQLQVSRGQSGPALAALVRRLSDAQSHYGTEPTIALMLAQVHYGAGQWAEAEAAARRALVIDPTMVAAEAFATLASLQRRAAAQTLTAENAQQDRQLLVALAQRSPDNPFVKAALFESYGLTREPPSRESVVQLGQAMLLLPQRIELRVNLAIAYVSLGEAAAARRLLTSVANDPHGGGQAQLATALIAWIDAGATGSPPTPSTNSEE